MKQMKKNRKTSTKIVIMMLIGAIAGFSSSIVFAIAKRLFENDTVSNLFLILSENVTWIHLGVAVIFEGIALLLYFKAKRVLVELKNSEDDDELESSFDDHMNLLILFNTVFIALNFVFFGISFDIHTRLVIFSLIIFSSFAVLTTIIEIKAVKLIQLKDPQKTADPTSIKFDKQWLDSCDEAERLKIYKSSYKTFLTMKYVLLILTLFTLFTKIEFNTGNYPIVLVGTIWIIQSGTYCLYSQFHSKRKLA
jgi:hypothetical protein